MGHPRPLADPTIATRWVSATRKLADIASRVRREVISGVGHTALPRFHLTNACNVTALLVIVSLPGQRLAN